MAISPTVRVNVSGARGESQADILRRTGQYGVLTTDTDAQAMAKLNAAAEAASAEAEGYAQDAANSFSSIDALANMYPSQAAGEAAVTNGYFTFVDGDDNIVYVRRVAGVSTIISPGAFVNLTGTQTVTGTKTFEGITRFVTNGDRIGVTSGSAPLLPDALVHIRNEDAVTCGLRVQSLWTGSTALPYQNNDNSLWETFNEVTSDSANFSWSISAPNAYNDIPEGVHDSGERVGVYGWATSVTVPGLYVHAGRLTSQIGVRGRAGFQGDANPSPATARIDKAVGVQGEIRADSVDATINDARAGNFLCVIEPDSGIVENSIAVYAWASGGTEANWSFFGAAGEFYQEDSAYFGNGSFTAAQSGASISIRGVDPNSLEFGNGDPDGYGSNIGASAASGNPFIAFSAEAMPTGNNFRTRGKLGSVIRGDLAGAVLFSRITNANASNQAPTDDVIWRPDGKFLFLKNPRIVSAPPASASATGEQGEIAWDAGYIYVCTADNTWKRAALATW